MHGFISFLTNYRNHRCYLKYRSACGLYATIVGFSAPMAGCSMDSSSDESADTQGELQAVRFQYSCLNESDSFYPCSGNDFPPAIAVGATFGVTANAGSSGALPRVVPAVSSRISETVQGAFRAEQPGLTALLAQQGGEILDLLHVQVAAVDELYISVNNQPITREIEVSLGETITLGVAPYSAGSGQMLAGALDYVWLPIDSEFGSLDVQPFSRFAVFQARKSGSVQVQVNGLGISTAVWINVIDGDNTTSQDDSTDGTTDDSTSTTSMDSDSGSDSDTTTSDSTPSDSTTMDSTSDTSTSEESTATDDSSATTDSSSSDSTGSSSSSTSSTAFVLRACSSKFV